MEKVAIRAGLASRILVGAKLEGGRIVAITGHNDGIMLYDASRERGPGLPQLPELVKTVHHGGSTSPITALFTGIRFARKCLYSPNLQSWDPR